jgi:CRP/FNR family transcriptional regulator, anaerobic regulatory protein
MEVLLKFVRTLCSPSEESIDYLAKTTKHWKIPKREFLLQAGEVCENLYFIKSGLLRCYYLKGDAEVSTWFLRENDMVVSVDSFYDQVPSYEYIQALEDCELISIGFYELEELFQTYPEHERIGRLMTLKYLRIWTRQLHNIRMLSAAERYRRVKNCSGFRGFVNFEEITDILLPQEPSESDPQ